MVFPGLFREALSAGPNLSFSLGVVLPHLNRLPALSMNSAEKLNGFGTVIGSETSPCCSDSSLILNRLSSLRHQSVNRTGAMAK